MSGIPQYRGHGVGGALLERCTARARNWGVRVMFMNCLVENAAMMHLARKQDLKIAVSGAEAEAFRAFAAGRPDKPGRRRRRRAPWSLRPRPEILLAGAASPASALSNVIPTTWD